MNYNEIFYTSSEKSALSGQAGFGVRTYTQGMDSAEVEDIARKAVSGYAVQSDRQVDMQQLQSNPKIVYDFPCTYSYKKIQLDNGEIRYLLSRTVYVGIDYGYFCGRGEYMRTGTNYLVHMLVFREEPSTDILAVMAYNNLFKNNVFLPLDYTCSPDNQELKRLLTGEPSLLEPGKFDLSRITCPDLSINADFATLIIGLLQIHSNKLVGKEIELQKLIVKAPIAVTDGLVGRLSLLPGALVNGKFFTTNYTGDSGVPDGLDVIFVNENNTNELYEDNYVCIDLFTGKSIHIDDNYMYDRLKTLADEADKETILKLVDYFLGLDFTKNNDYRFLYNLFVLTESDQSLAMDDLSESFIDRLVHANLSSAQETVIWEKINGTINAGLQANKRAADVWNAINIVGVVRRLKNNKLDIVPQSRVHLARILFNFESNFDKFVKSENVELITFIIDVTQIPSPENLFRSLLTSNNANVWKSFILFYYKDKIQNEIGYILENIFKSGIEGKSKEELVLRLFPLDKYKKDILDYLLTHPDNIGRLPNTVRNICLGADKECFSAFLQASSNDTQTISTLAPILLEYYSDKMRIHADRGMAALMELAATISSDVFNRFQVESLFADFINCKFENPDKSSKTLLETINGSKIHIHSSDRKKLENLLKLLNNEIPEHPDIAVVLAACKMGKKNDYVISLFEDWLREQPQKEQIKSFVKQVGKLESEVIAGIVLALWKSRVHVIRAEREKYILAVTDNVNWHKRDFQTFLSSCKEKDLVEFLSDSTKFWKNLIRKIFNL